MDPMTDAAVAIDFAPIAPRGPGSTEPPKAAPRAWWRQISNDTLILDGCTSATREIVDVFIQRATGRRLAPDRQASVAQLVSVNADMRDWAQRENSSRAQQISELCDFIDAWVAERQKEVEARIGDGFIEFHNLPFLFSTGKEACFDIEGELVGGIVESANIQRSFFGTYVEVDVRVLYSLGTAPAEGVITARIGSYDGERALNDLPVRLIDDEVRAKLTKRGRVWQRATADASYMSYSGQIIQDGWWSTQHYRAEGRVIVDSATFARIAHDQSQMAARAAGFEFHRRENSEPPPIINEGDLWRTYPFVYGFSFAAKQWGRMAVSGLSEIKWREDAFDKLVLPAREKDLIRSIVEHSGGSFSDIVEGKGGGSIFLLHGPPGQGKTLTAETVAESLKRPLYSISVGELGTGPDDLEKRLRQILDVATVWNAVLLLDEADIFLEARDERDIVRNAMVGVFLRLLEYHQGVLFLTTNRVRNIDQAFYSRISVALKFGEADVQKRQMIWDNLLSAAGVTGLDTKRLAVHHLNGRQIKNVIRLSQTLATSKGGAVTPELVDEVVELTTNFDPHEND